jgi:hypothetical protein
MLVIVFPIFKNRFYLLDSFQIVSYDAMMIGLSPKPIQTKQGPPTTKWHVFTLFYMDM